MQHPKVPYETNRYEQIVGELHRVKTGRPKANRVKYHEIVVFNHNVRQMIFEQAMEMADLWVRFGKYSITNLQEVKFNDE